MFLHLNGAPEVAAQPRVAGCEPQKMARIVARPTRAREEKVFRPAWRAKRREVRSAKRSESRLWLTKKGAENIRRDSVRRLLQGYDGFLHVLQYRARHEGAYTFKCGRNVKTSQRRA